MMSSTLGAPAIPWSVPPRLSAYVEICSSSKHERSERVRIFRLHRRDQASDRLLEGHQRFHAVFVEALDLEVQLRTLGRHAARDVHLRIESRAREPRKPERGLARVGKRGEE